MMSSSIRVASRSVRPMARPMAPMRARAQQLQSVRFNSSSGGSSGGGGSDLYIVLGALGALGVGGYVYLKPVRDVAAKMNAGMEKAQEMTQGVADTAAKAGKVAAKAGEVAKDGAVQAASAVADGDLTSGDGIIGMATRMIPSLATAVSTGGVGGLLYKLKDADLTAALDMLKNTGNEEITKVVEAVRSKLDEADGKVEKVDWKGLAHDLSKEFGGKYQSTIDSLVGKIPSVDDFNDYVTKIKEHSVDQLQDIEAAANKVYKNVESAAKDKKNTGDAFVAGIKATKDEDIDALAAAIKSLLKDAGLPADSVVDYAKAKAKDGRDSAEEYAKDLQGKFDLAAKWLPVDEETAVKAASGISPSLGKIVQELLDEAKDKVEDVKKVAEKGKKAVEDKVKK